MHIGYVSDEYYSALEGVALDFEHGSRLIATTRSSATGAVQADVPPGRYRVTLAKSGYGSKTVDVEVRPDVVLQFRLLSNSLYGYAWPKWVRAGQEGEFRVHSPEPYHISLWRYGNGKRLVHAIGWMDEHGPNANLQVLPDGDFTQSGVRWNYRGYSKQYGPDGRCSVHGENTRACSTTCFSPAHRVTAPAESGLYCFHVETASGRFLSFPWIVAPPHPVSKIAVLASTNTWNAYNNFGGRSNYINPTELRARPTVNARLDLARYVSHDGVWSARDPEYRPLSFDRPEPFNHIPREVRPEDPIRGRQACHLAEAEWRLLAWLEREQFSYDIYSDYQLHSGEVDLKSYKALIISTHPEYWSREAYRRVKQWVFEAGGKLLYLGGNGIDCEVEFIDDATMRCKTWLPNPTGALQLIDPDSGRHYECRFHHKVESPALLLGVVFTEPGCGTSAPYRVVKGDHWVFAGTELHDNDTFGTNSQHERCPGGASGHETDKRSPSSPANTVLLARGLNSGNGGAEMVLHETSGGGAVFSVGSITWPASLLVDAHVSRITRNVIERFTT